MSSLPEVVVAETISDELRNERVMANQGLVHQVARGFRSRGIPLEDLVQFGNIGLIRAAEKFEPERGLKFSTYAVYWIRQAIFKAITNTSRPIRVPLHAQKEGVALYRKANAMEAESGVRPWLSEAMNALNIPDNKRERVLRAAEAASATFGAKPLEEVIRAVPPEHMPEHHAILFEQREQFNRAWPLLPEEYRELLTMRYGLDGSPPMVIMAVAACMGISWRAAQRMEYAAISMLRRLVREGSIKGGDDHD